MELLKRFLLVGLFVVVPFKQGSIMQVASANITTILFLVLQLEAMPYKEIIDDYLSVICNLLLTVMFLVVIFYKYVTLTEMPDIYDRMSREQRDDFKVSGVLLSVFFVRLRASRDHICPCLLTAATPSRGR